MDRLGVIEHQVRYYRGYMEIPHRGARLDQLLQLVVPVVPQTVPKECLTHLIFGTPVSIARILTRDPGQCKKVLSSNTACVAWKIVLVLLMNFQPFIPSVKPINVINSA